MARTPLVILMWLIYFQTSEHKYSVKSHTASDTSPGTDFINETISEQCQKLGYCEISKQYPIELTQKLIKELETANIVLDSDVNKSISSVENRFGGIGHYRNPCKFITKQIKPLIAKYSLDGKWYYVLNSIKDPIQVYTVQKCAHNNSTASSNNHCGPIILHNDYKPQCTQKYITRSVVVVDYQKKKLFTIPVEIPCCCSCIAIEKPYFY